MTPDQIEEIIKLINEKGLIGKYNETSNTIVLQGWGFEFVLKNDAWSMWHLTDTTGG